MPTRTPTASSSCPPAASLVPAVTSDTLAEKGDGLGPGCASSENLDAHCSASLIFSPV